MNRVVTIPQRYAIDFVGLNVRGHALEVSPDQLRDSANTDWFGYDTDVLAVADGVVRDARMVSQTVNRFLPIQRRTT